MPLRRLAIVGTGLIGASIGMAAKRAGVEHVSGYDADPEDGLRAKAKNLAMAMAYAEADAIVAPTAFQAGALPPTFQDRIRIIHEWIEGIDLVLLRPPVLSRAGEPMPVPIGSLDAIHLATALIWRDRVGALDEMATHDAVLGAAAQVFGFEVRGL